MKLLISLSSIIINLLVCLLVYLNKYSFILVYWWLASIVIFLLPYQQKTNFNFVKILKKIKLEIFLLMIVVFLPVYIRILDTDISRIHPDETIVAYFSAQFDFLKTNFFSGIPQDNSQFQSQYPSPYFVLQKLFFILFGESIWTIKLSMIPYVLIISIMLYLITKEVLNRKLAYISIFLYAFSPISIYLETLGIQVTSGTAAFLIFFYIAILYYKKNNTSLAFGMGISAGFCYLFYISSYIALPIMFLLFIIKFIKYRKLHILSHAFIAIISLVLVLSPFITQIFRFKNNYFTQRLSQTTLIRETSDIEEKNNIFNRYISDSLKKNFADTFKSFYRNGIGGAGGYNFENLAMFERYSLILFISGFILSLILYFRKFEFWLIYLVIVLSFIAIAAAVPPPAYHHFALAIPFVAMLSAVPIYLILSIKFLKLYYRYLVIILLISIYIFNNQNYFLKSVKKERGNINLRIADYINNNYPYRNIYVASFPGYAFEKIYYFSPNKRVKKIRTEYHENILKVFNRDERYVYVILFPDEFNKKFVQLDPNGKLIDFYYNKEKFLSLFVN